MYILQIIEKKVHNFLQYFEVQLLNKKTYAKSLEISSSTFYFLVLVHLKIFEKFTAVS